MPEQDGGRRYQGDLPRRGAAARTDPDHVRPGRVCLRRAAGGASGFLLKSAPPEELLYAIRSVHKGDSIVAPSTTRRLIGRFLPHLPDTGEPPPDLAELTAREREVLAQAGCGLSNAEIAALLSISEVQSKPTSATSWLSSACVTGSRSSSTPTRPVSSSAGPDSC